jgi:hypothetical protein
MNRPVIVYGPQGCGKTRFAERIAKHFGLTKIVDEFIGVGNLRRGVLYLMTEATAPWYADCEQFSFDEVAQQINAAIPMTDWFHGDTDPVHVGVYQTDHDYDKSRPGYCYWDGQRWGCERTNREAALLNPFFKGAVQAKDWRGLSEEPLPVVGAA